MSFSTIGLFHDFNYSKGLKKPYSYENWDYLNSKKAFKNTNYMWYKNESTNVRVGVPTV